MTLTVISHRGEYDAVTDLVTMPATDEDQQFTITISGTTLMDREGVVGLSGAQILELVFKYRRDIAETGETLRRHGQADSHNRIDILAFEPISCGSGENLLESAVGPRRPRRKSES